MNVSGHWEVCNNGDGHHRSYLVRSEELAGPLKLLSCEDVTDLMRWLGKSMSLRLILPSHLFSTTGIFAWAIYVRLLYRLGATQHDANSLLIRSIPLAIRFLIRSTATLPETVFPLVMFIFIWLTIYITYQDNLLSFVPMMHFDAPSQAFTIWIHIAFSMAIGVHCCALFQETVWWFKAPKLEPDRLSRKDL